MVRMQVSGSARSFVCSRRLMTLWILYAAREFIESFDWSTGLPLIEPDLNEADIACAEAHLTAESGSGVSFLFYSHYKHIRAL